MSRNLVATERRELQTRDALSRGLTAKQRQFAEARGKGLSLAKAALAAGYQCNKENARSIGWQLSQDLQISRLVAWYARNALAAATGVAAKVLTDVATDDTVKPEHRVKAANSILARGGVPVSQDIAVEHSGEVQHRPATTLNDLRAKVGLPPVPENPPRPPPEHIVDAEFTPVDAQPTEPEW